MGVRLEEAKAYKISEEQARYIISIIDKNIELHKEKYGHLCIQPEKRVDSAGKQICDSECDNCMNVFYAKRREEMMRKVGLCNK